MKSIPANTKAASGALPPSLGSTTTTTTRAADWAAPSSIARISRWLRSRRRTRRYIPSRYRECLRDGQLERGPRGVLHQQQFAMDQPKRTVTTLAMLPVASLLRGPAGSLAQTPVQAKQKEPLAVVAGQTIYDDDLLPFVQSQVFQLRLQEYDVKSKALENLVNQKLLEAEAKKKGIPTEKVLEQDVDAKVAYPTQGESQSLYITQNHHLGNP